MSTLFDPTLGLSQFSLPEQDIRLLSFCESNKLVKLKQWVEELKLTQIGQSSVGLYRATPEVVRLKTDSKTRFEMLESLWTPSQECLQGLSKEYLQKPLILPEKARNAAILTQALQKHFVDGYSVCISDFVSQRRLKSYQQDLAIRCIARALSAINLVVLRAYQLYSNVPGRLWQRAHVLYQIAEYYDIQDAMLPAGLISEGAIRTIKDLYIRLNAMGCVRANQLAQMDIAKIYQFFAQHIRSIKLLPSISDGETSIYIINASSDSGPVAKNRFEGTPDDKVYAIDFASLVNQLQRQDSKESVLSSPQEDSDSKEKKLPDSLLTHILECWVQSAERNQPRQTTETEAEVCVGMIDCHFHLCGAVAFQEFLHPQVDSEESEFLSGNFDNLVASLSHKEKDIDQPALQRQTTYWVSIVNSSPGGYCIFWQGDLPNKMEAGELIGLREKGRRSWSIGVIRWVKQLKQASQLGIQILSTQPVPYAAAVTYDMGGYSDYMRAIHIPSPIMPDQPPGILTPAIPFQENSRVKLKQDEQQVDVRLNQCHFSTRKIRLFSFETLSSKDEEEFY